ncbi:MAG: FMN-binding protein [Eubacterium sp.]|nr:FMN-binding protein [Eubacterium sp.]
MKKFKGSLFLIPSVICMVAAVVGFQSNIPVFDELKLPILNKEIQGKEIVREEKPERNKEIETGTIKEKVESLEFHGGEYRDGKYTGSAQGFGGMIRVLVTIKEGKMNSIDVVEHGKETPSYYAMAEKIVPDILKKQSPNVDVISGATYSSNGIKNAVIDALNQAAGKPAETYSTQEDDATKETDTKKIKGIPADGVFEGSAICEKFDYTIQLKVKFKDGKTVAISSLKLLNNDDRENVPYCNRAWKPTIKNILKKQSGNVDGVSGATYSSNGIKDAYLNALEKAIAKNEGRREKKKKEKKVADKSIGDDVEISGGKIYDGAYDVTALCSPDEEEEFAPYHLTATFEFKNGALTGITNVKSDADENKKYYLWALNGKGNQPGVLEQLLKNQGTKGLSAVSGATCSSLTWKELYRKASERAQGKRETSTENMTQSIPEEVTTYNPEAKNVQVSTWVYAMEDEWGEYDFEDYELFASVTFLNDKLCNISILDCGDTKNRYYCDMAVNGTAKKEGMLSKFLRAGSADADIVSGATCTSEALKEIYNKAIKQYEEMEGK